ncbi:restriction endonuclease subunit S [Pseudomonas botevensis]|uniref:restriction endonuclease subunit S n=1 Tax=Pseudomonas botevensis TaxID=2842352 RepID=UPI001C3D69AA|nr:restriction endonuclease subunit S [Pseudomonas botevensis]MBV4474679.1 restriction endonuclease subunit S [Pseudomonas botevensis]
MSSEWPLVRLADHVVSSLGKMLDAKKNKGAFQPYLGNSNVRWGKFDISSLAEMRFESHEDERYSLRPGDLVVCEGGEPGRCAIWTGPPGIKIQKALHRIRSKETLDNYYLFYWFCLAARTGYLEPHFTGTTIKHLTGKAIAALEVPLPPLIAQRAMVDVLRKLDDRISLLGETNATLEAIAQALFKSWFVDFDPVRAKAEGFEPEGMDAATAALFPDSFEEPELGLVPVGWRTLLLEHAYEINPSRKLKKGCVAPYLDMANVSTQGHVVSNVVEREIGSGAKFINGDTLLARITPCLENGKTAFVDFLLLDQVGWGSTEFLVLRPKAPLPVYHGYLLARHSAFREYVVQSMSGTSGRQRVQNDVLGRYPVVIPTKEVADAFEAIVSSIQQKITANQDQVKTLTQLRDTLLPRLISGKLRLPIMEDDIETTLSEIL